MKAKRAMSLMLLILLVASTFVAPAAAIVEASDHIRTKVSDIYAIGNEQIEVSFVVRGAGTMATLGVTRITLQESSDGVNWSGVHLYKYEDYEDMPNGNIMMSYNEMTHEGVVRYNGTSGMKYRAYIAFYAHDGETGQTITEFTSSVTAR